MYRKILREIDEIKRGESPVKPQDLANTVADLLSDGELTTGQYLDLMNLIRALL
jgi:hypothetical protein